ncbi:hypothetical protein P4562_21485 [Lysinibacillus xylanilyticus]|uniref:hypothetical protein n=1 Tax=Lysinibacillus xylanilyticus TaxID=582475 RepID=UPI002E203F72|nr:hypothetical protein [Lysinibacillus xylanilyticus]
MLEQLLVQKKLQHYITYVKNLIIGLAEEFQTEKVHYRRILPVIDRLFSHENKEFLSFFNGKKNRESLQLLQLMHQQGEIINEGKGYYSVLPTRVIQFPEEETNILVSSYDFMSNESYCGLAQLPINQQIIYPVLKPDDYSYRPVLTGIMSILEKKLSLLNLDISEMIRFISGRQQKTSLVTNIKEGEWFIAIHETPFNSKNFYVALKRDNTIYGTYILKQNYLRICFALCDYYGIENKYTVNPLINGLVEIYFNRQLPREELSLLNLIALPNCYENPKKFITHELQLGNIQSILESLKLKEME